MSVRGRCSNGSLEAASGAVEVHGVDDEEGCAEEGQETSEQEYCGRREGESCGVLEPGYLDEREHGQGDADAGAGESESKTAEGPLEALAPWSSGNCLITRVPGRALPLSLCREEDHGAQE